MNLRSLVLSLVFIWVLGFSGNAHALGGDSILWDWSYQTTSSTDGPIYLGSGTITTDSTLINSGITGYLITGITGTMNGSAITGLVGIGGFGNNDNILAPTSPQLDSDGFTFVTANGYTYNPFNFENVYQCGSEDSGDNFQGADNAAIFTATVVPEPSQYGLGILLAMAGLIARRRLKAA